MIRYETAVQSQPIPGTYTMTGYVYDAAGNRVAKGTILTMSCDPSVNGYQATNDYVRGPGQVAQSNATKPYPRRNETVPRSSQSYRDERALTTVPMPAPNHTEGACRCSRGCCRVGAADGRLVVEATMGSFVVVIVDPRLQVSISLF